ncbi:hypothetical protein EX30DRAFT_185838 [Ascodesmis nigricans]|uniref:Uncharacterized protein n=1 Tax=Ascodesmis nigricans TaxID=341454 RepID=A0A4S2N0B7_9PEZI|nr:hypothetical protein EX30DRAFT_185838 [Ascodesmis nigricans]
MPFPSPLATDWCPRINLDLRSGEKQRPRMSRETGNKAPLFSPARCTKFAHHLSIIHYTSCRCRRERHQHFFYPDPHSRIKLRAAACFHRPVQAEKISPVTPLQRTHPRIDRDQASGSRSPPPRMRGRYLTSGHTRRLLSSSTTAKLATIDCSIDGLHPSADCCLRLAAQLGDD